MSRCLCSEATSLLPQYCLSTASLLPHCCLTTTSLLPHCRPLLPQYCLTATPTTASLLPTTASLLPLTATPLLPHYCLTTASLLPTAASLLDALLRGGDEADGVLYRGRHFLDGHQALLQRLLLFLLTGTFIITIIIIFRPKSS